MVIFNPRRRMAIGNLGCGPEDSHRRKSGWVSPVQSSSTICDTRQSEENNAVACNCALDLEHWWSRTIEIVIFDIF